MQLNTVYNMDYREGIKHMITNNIKVDLIIADPPYGIANDRIIQRNGKPINFGFGSWDMFDDEEKGMFLFLDEMYGLFSQILKPTGTCLVYTSAKYISFLGLLEKKHGLYHKADSVWHKTNPTPQFRKTNYLSSYEMISFSVKEKGLNTFNFKEQKQMHNFITTTGEGGVLCIIQTPLCMGNERKEGLHPTQKRLDVSKHLIDIHSNKDDIILIPFCGSGTEAKASMLMKRRFIAFELNNEFVNTANKRLIV